MQINEIQAIALLKNGDISGLEYLVNQYQVKAVQTAFLITGDPYAAEDITQNAFLRAAERIGQFNDQLPFQPWFIRTVINEAIKYAKKQTRNTSLDGYDESVLDWLKDAKPLPEKYVEDAELRNQVFNALMRLSPDQRKVIIQRHFLEMNEAEMANDLNRPRSTVKWWLHTARKKLRFIWNGNQRENEGVNHENS